MGFRINKLTELTYVSEGLERGLINGWRPFENEDAVSALRNVLYSRYGYILARTAVKHHIKTYFRIYTYLNGVYYPGNIVRVNIFSYNINSNGNIANYFTPSYKCKDNVSTSYCILRCIREDKVIGYIKLYKL